jgi:hypothetical protein
MGRPRQMGAPPAARSLHPGAGTRGGPCTPSPGAPASGPASPSVGATPSSPSPIADLITKIPAATLSFLRSAHAPETTRRELIDAAAANPAVTDWRNLLRLLDSQPGPKPGSMEDPGRKSGPGDGAIQVQASAPGAVRPMIQMRRLAGLSSPQPAAPVSSAAPAPAPCAPLPAMTEDECIARTFHAMEGSADRWRQRQATGLGDDDLAAAIRFEWGCSFCWGNADTGMWTGQGDVSKLRLAHSRNGVTREWKGAELLATARRVLGIPVASVDAVR